jgi:hypothetical protein
MKRLGLIIILSVIVLFGSCALLNLPANLSVENTSSRNATVTIDEDTKTIVPDETVRFKVQMNGETSRQIVVEYTFEETATQEKTLTVESGKNYLLKLVLWSF